ncbi:MAG: HAD family hydrolase [Armatimonadetes bacterium]|nr:HAD family hydrolase [Armatimonadota bacterium]
MIRALFFDLDDTLIRYDAPYEVALTASHTLLASRHPNVSLSDLRTAIHRAYEKRYGYKSVAGFAEAGAISVRAMREALTADALATLETDDATDTAFIGELIAAHEAVEAREIVAFPDTHNTLDVLQNHFALGVITNGPSAMQRAKLAATGLASRFAHVVVDSEFGHPKPDGRIFAHAARIAGFAPEQLLFVGNSPEADVAGSVRAGWTSVWVNATGAPLPPGTPTPHYEIKTLGELMYLPTVADVLRRD